MVFSGKYWAVGYALGVEINVLLYQNKLVKEVSPFVCMRETCPTAEHLDPKLWSQKYTMHGHAGLMQFLI